MIVLSMLLKALCYLKDSPIKQEQNQGEIQCPVSKETWFTPEVLHTQLSNGLAREDGS